MEICKKCGKDFIPEKGLKSYCSMMCRNSRMWTDEDKLKKSISATNSEKVKNANILNNLKKVTPPILITCLGCGKDIITKDKNRKYHKECWLSNSGGYRIDSTKKYRSFYNGYQMDSNSEKEFAIYCDKNKIKWIKNTDKYFEYIGVDNKKHKYYPDFYIEEFDYWVEIKGKLYADKDPNLENKLKSVQNIKIIYSKNIKRFSFDELKK